MGDGTMGHAGVADLNWHHKEVTLLDFKWVNKCVVINVELRQFEEEVHEGQTPSIILVRASASGQEDIMIISGRTGSTVLVSLEAGQRLIAKIGPNPNSAGTAKWEFVA